MDSSSLKTGENPERGAVHDDFSSARLKLSEKRHDTCVHCQNSLSFNSEDFDEELTNIIQQASAGTNTTTDPNAKEDSAVSKILQRSLTSGTKGEYSPNRAYMPEGNRPMVISLVGLPARGKTYISKKLTRYLNWIGISTKVFHMGDYRRQLTGGGRQSHEFFDPGNEATAAVRERSAQLALDDIRRFFDDEGGEIAVFDATNSTRDRRRQVVDFCAEGKFSAFFIESFCDSEAIVEANILDVKVNTPDYLTFADKEAAAEDFRKRIQHYASEYQPIEQSAESAMSFIRIINQGERFLINRLQGNVQSRIVYYLMNIKVQHNRQLYLIRHGESMLNVLGRIGGDADLSERGRQFARRLAAWIDERNCDPNRQLRVWTSHLRRTIQTAAFIRSPHSLEHWKALNEIDAGVCEGMTYEEIADKFPIEFASRDKDKFNYRYPGGESYGDLVARLEPVIMELERQAHVLVVCHQAVARCLLAYFLDKTHQELPYIRVPLHHVLRLTPAAYGCSVEFISLDVPSVNTHRDRPQVADTST